MSYYTEQAPPSDVCLLLRAHAEQRWLSREVIPVLRQLQTRELLPEEQFGAALAYLEVIWIEAQQRAKETDAAHADLSATEDRQSQLSGKACRYHASIRDLREVVAGRVNDVLKPPVALDPSNGTVLATKADDTGIY